MQLRSFLSFPLLCTLLAASLFIHAQTPESDEAAVREVIRKYYFAYESYDFEAQKALYSPNSTDPGAKIRNTKESTQKSWTQPKIEKFDIWNVTMDGDKATVLAKVLLTTFRKDNGKPVGGWFNRETSLRHSLVRENGEWKISYIEFRVFDLTKAISTAKTDAEREAIAQQYAELSESEITSAFLDAAIGFARNELDHTRALAAIQQGYKIAEAANDKDSMATALAMMAGVYTRLGDHGQSLLSELRFLELTEQLGEKGNLPNALNSVGVAYAILEDYPRAIEYYQRGVEVRERVAGVKKGNLLHGNLARSYMALGEYDRAQKILEMLLAESEAELANPGNSASQPRLAQLKTAVARNLEGLGNLHLEKGDQKSALELFFRAAEMTRDSTDKGFTQYLFKRMAEAFLQLGKYAESLSHSERAASIAVEMGVEDLAWDAKVTHGKALAALGRREEARAAFAEATRIIEAMRTRAIGSEEAQERFFGSKAAAYRAMAAFLAADGSPAEALSVAETAKARILLGLIKGGHTNVSKAMTEAENLEERRLLGLLSRLNNELANESRRAQVRQERLAQLREQVTKARRDTELFRTKLFIDHPELRVERGELSPITLDDAASLIPPKGAIVEFAVAADQTVVFLLTRDSSGKGSIVAKSIKIKDTDLAAQVEAYRSKLAAGDLDFQAPARKLHELLLGPVAGQLAGKTELVIIPDGPLWDLPFQTLTNKSGKYLVENIGVSYALSLTTLREMARPSGSSGSHSDRELIAFGNPIVGKDTSERVKRVFMSEKLDPLPEAERLVVGLAKMYGPARSKIFTGAAAREQIAKDEAPRFRIVQFATHGILNNVSPMYSHLVLARDEKNPKEDGLLEAWEMKDLDLKADMVILSACDTARGRISGGEGVIGMTWAMFIAGAPTTVASQWKVESSSTTEFMLEFHRQMLGKQKISKAEALRRASLKLMKMPQYRHPSYWGAWVLVGDGS